MCQLDYYQIYIKHVSYHNSYTRKTSNEKKSEVNEAVNCDKILNTLQNLLINKNTKKKKTNLKFANLIITTKNNSFIFK